MHKKELIDKFKTCDKIWEYILYNEDLYREYIVNEEQIKNIKKQMNEKGINVLSYNDELYPKKLKVYDDFPCLLFYKGDVTWLDSVKSAAIVGSRKCSPYGINVTELIASSLTSSGVAIISGMAKGIDSIAQNCCVKNGGCTCGVLGNGIDVIYPKENKKLYEEVSESGCILSEFPPGTPPLSTNFPIRNRIISALSDIIVVVEAGVRSGSLITAHIGLEQGKTVIAVPGSVFSPQSKGTNDLIKDGAGVFTQMSDIEYDLKIEESKNYIKNDLEKNNMSSIEKKLYGVISNNPIHIDDIIRITNIDINRVYELLFEMQFKKEIMCLSGNYYVRINNKL